MMKMDFLIHQMGHFGTQMEFILIKKDMINMEDIMMIKPRNMYLEKDGMKLIIVTKMKLMMIIMMNLEVIMMI